MIQANPSILLGNIERLCAIPRASTDFDGQREAAASITRQLESYGHDVRHQGFDVDGGRTQNVIASAGPAGAPRIVIGAHYDTCGPFAGADDNASGVAGLLELARLVRLIRSDLPCRIDLIAFALEEPPYFGTPDMGSFRHARSLAANNESLALMMSLEMIGYFSNLPNSQELPPSLSPALRQRLPDRRGDFIAVAARPQDGPLPEKVAALMQRGTELSVIGAKIGLYSEMSDNANYWDHGFPAVMVTDTSMLRNPHYHAATDKPETLDYMSMAGVIDGILCLIRNFDDHAARSLNRGRRI